MNIDKIIKQLKSGRKNYLEIKDFSDQPGIYSIFFSGNKFLVEGANPKENEIIYVGKTESSQKSRDADTHFKSGKTGSSTVRRSIGSLLREEFKLEPIPRNDSDFLAGRTSHYKFDPAGEEIITHWMQSNLALSFYEYPKSRTEIVNLETKLIHKLIPILNIDKNPNNPYGKYLANQRKKCARLAFKKIGEIKSPTKKRKLKMNTVSAGKYIKLWRNYLPRIEQELSDISTQKVIQLDSNDFDKVGNRRSYSFNLEYESGIVSNNICGSAVARDLVSVIAESDSIKKLIETGHIKINMDKGFSLHLKKIY